MDTLEEAPSERRSSVEVSCLTTRGVEENASLEELAGFYMDNPEGVSFRFRRQALAQALDQLLLDRFSQVIDSQRCTRRKSAPIVILAAIALESRRR